MPVEQCVHEHCTELALFLRKHSLCPLRRWLLLAVLHKTHVHELCVIAGLRLVPEPACVSQFIVPIDASLLAHTMGS